MQEKLVFLFILTYSQNVRLKMTLKRSQFSDTIQYSNITIIIFEHNDLIGI